MSCKDSGTEKKKKKTTEKNQNNEEILEKAKFLLAKIVCEDWSRLYLTDIVQPNS